MADVHAHHDLHRGPAAGGSPQGAARLLRLRRGRLLFAGDAARQPRRPRAHQAAPARAGRRRHSATSPPPSSASRPPLPLALAPIGLCGMQHGDGEILACRAAQAAGIPFTLSTMSICSIEDVAEAVGKPFWFQLYVMRDRGFIRRLIERAAAAKCSALVLTVDLQVLGQRHCDIKNGMTVPPRDQARQPHRHRHQAGLGALASSRASARPSAISPATCGHGERQFAGAMDREPVRSDAELEGRRVDQEPVAGQAHPQGHPRRRGRPDRGQDRRRRAHRIQPRRPPARRRAVVDLGAAEGRRCGRRRDRGDVRRRHPHRRRT